MCKIAFLNQNNKKNAEGPRIFAPLGANSALSALFGNSSTCLWSGKSEGTTGEMVYFSFYQ